MTDDVLVLVNKLASLEAELMALRTELAKLLGPDREHMPIPSFVSLEGIWAGQGDFSLEEMRSTESHLPLELS